MNDAIRFCVVRIEFIQRLTVARVSHIIISSFNEIKLILFANIFFFLKNDFK